MTTSERPEMRSGHLSQTDDMESFGWSEVRERPAARGTLAEQTTEYQQLLHRRAMDRLSQELTQVVRTIPRPVLPTYVDGKVTARPSSPSLALELPHDPERINRIYSRSAVQRYVLQRLASDLHAPLEASREEIPFRTFRDVLEVPLSMELPKLNPQVRNRTDLPGTAAAATSAAATPPPPSPGGRTAASGSTPMRGVVADPTSSLPPMDPLERSLRAAHEAAAGSQGAGQSRARLVFDAMSYSNVNSGARIVKFKC